MAPLAPPATAPLPIITKKELVYIGGHHRVKAREYGHRCNMDELKKKYRNALLRTLEMMMTGVYDIKEIRFSG